MSNIRELSQLAASIVVDDSTRNIGIGTSSPSSKLSVGGDLNVSGVITATAFIGDGSNLTGISTFSGNYNDLTNTPEIPSIVGLASEGFVTEQVSNLIDGAPDALNTLNELAAALDDDSNFAATITNSLSTKISGVGIQSTGVSVGTGITTLNFIGAGNTFTVNGSVADISISGGGGGASVSIGTEAPTDPSSGDLWYNSNLGRTFIYYTDEDSSQWVDSAPFNIGNISSIDGPLIISGDLQVTGVVTATDFDAASDFNLKTNIKSIDNPIEKVMQLNGVTFTWKESNQDSIGVIAQEVENVFPELVRQSETHKSVNYNGLIGVLIEVVKDQQKQIDELKSKIG
jgi:hypothetical protein